MVDLLIRQVHAYTPKDAGVVDIAVQGERIAAIAPHLDGPATREIDGRGLTALPGLIETHAHMLLPFAGTRTNNDFYDGTMSGAFGGVTTLVDFADQVKGKTGPEQALAQRRVQARDRGCLCYEVSDRYGAEGARQGIDENMRFARKAAADTSGMFRGMMGLHASYTLGEQTLRDCVEAEKSVGCGIHTHLAEDVADVTDSYKSYDKHVAERMDDAGALGPKTIAAHGVHFKPRHWTMLKERGVTVAHNCQSNMNNAVGVAPVVQMLDAGVNVALGGDGYTYDLFRELSVAAIYQRAGWRDTSLFSGRQIRQFAFGNTAALCGRIFGRDIGQLKPGAAADFIVLNYAPPTPLNADNYISHLLCCSGANASGKYLTC